MKYFYILIILLTFSSCEKQLEFDAEDTKSKLVVNSKFSSGEIWDVHVSNSLSVIDNHDLEDIDDATVEIYDNGTYLETLTIVADGKYTGSTSPMNGHGYELKASAPGYESVSSTSNIPTHGLELIGYQTEEIEPSNGSYYYSEGKTLRTTLNIKDLNPGKSYYGVSVSIEYANSSGSSYTNEKYLASTDLAFKSDEGEYGYLLTFDDVLFDQGVYNLSIDVLDYKSSYDGEAYDFPVKLIINLHASSEDVYMFNKTIEQYWNSNGDPFSQPTQVYTNVNNGLGLFGGESTETFEYDL